MAIRFWACMTVLGSLVIPAAWGESTVSGTGTAYLEKAPELVRLTVDLKASGKDMAEVLKILKQKREAASAKLKELGLAENEVRWDGPKLPALPQSVPGASTVRMVNGRFMVGGTAQQTNDDELEDPKAVLTLVAEWPVKAKDADSALAEFAALKTKVKAADLMGRKGDKSEEEPDDGGGSLNWQFIAHMSEAEEAKLFSEAFAQAKANAGQLAAAAGLKLVAISNLGSRYIPPENDRAFPFSGSALTSPGFDKPEEIIGNQPHKVRFGAQITAVYQVQS